MKFEAIHKESLLSQIPTKVAVFMKCNTVNVKQS